MTCIGLSKYGYQQTEAAQPPASTHHEPARDRKRLHSENNQRTKRLRRHSINRDLKYEVEEAKQRKREEKVDKIVNIN